MTLYAILHFHAALLFLHQILDFAANEKVMSLTGSDGVEYSTSEYEYRKNYEYKYKY